MSNPISARLRDIKNREVLVGEMQSDGFGNGLPRDAQDAKSDQKQVLQDLRYKENEGDTK
jgi:hypothetical protein